MSLKYWCKHFVSFRQLREWNSVRDARIWVLDNFDREQADIFATDKDGYGGIAFAREEDMAFFLLRWS